MAGNESGTIRKVYAPNNKRYDDITYVQLAVVSETIPKVIRFLQKIQEEYVPFIEDNEKR